ncbi:hypothetical protein F4779DRAFT_625957 [Xylariaceae sp. FL0662B]|nr:hypothetical protein F4779DRAFT_625957 [Xylariaceae sp. FL0662B]
MTNTLNLDNSPKHGLKRKYAGDRQGLTGSDRSASARKLGPTTATQGKPIAHDETSEVEAEDGKSGTSNAATLSTSIAATKVGFNDDEYYRNLYAKELDFRALGSRDPEFAALLDRDARLDFSDPASVMQLTKTLLKLDFGLQIELPADRLCPPVPNRHNYILWLKDLIDSCSLASDTDGDGDPSEPYGRRVNGLDIGTGASAIYPLLGCAQRPSWSFVGTDVDSRSLSYARRNVALNNLQSRIRIVGPRNATADPLIPIDELDGIAAPLDFVMVNPPFYESEAEMRALGRQKSRPPNSACTGAPVEMVCRGGEVGFVLRMVEESLVLRERVRWYTSMLGKQSSLEVLVDVLRDRGITNYAVTAFVQGNKTRRWALAWSFGNRRPSLASSRGFEPLAGKKLLPHPTETTVAIWPISTMTREQLEKAICDAMEGLDLVSWLWDRQLSRGIGFVDGNVWSRAYRRKKARERMDAEPTMSETTEDRPSSPQQVSPKQDIAQCAFGFAISIHVSRNAKNMENKTALVARWLQGHDYALFESFAGMLRNSIRPEKT